MRYRRRMTGTRRLGLAFLAAAVCSMGCGRSEDRLRRDYRERSGYAEEETAFRPDLSGQGGAADITDTERMPDALKELYGFRNLEGHKLYWDQTVMQMDFHFNKDVTYSELDSARYFVLDKFVMNHWNQNAQTPYDSWLMEYGWGNVIPQVRCRLFVADTLIFQDNYKERRVEGYYENSACFVKAREAGFEAEEELAAMVSGKLGPAMAKEGSVSFQNSLRGDRLLVLVDTPRVLDGSVADSIQEGIADMAPVRIKEYPLIVLTMASDGSPYYTSVFVNRERENGWTALDWVNAVTGEDR